MNEEEQEIIASLETIREENSSIGKCLASLEIITGEMRASQIGVDVMLTDIEDKIKGK